jgi:hypothetical protein
VDSRSSIGRALAPTVAILGLAFPALGAITANEVVSYTPGAALSTYWGEPYDNASAALGLPTPHQDIVGISDGQGGFTVFPDDSVINPFNAPFNPNHVVGIGEGGTLRLKLEQPVSGTGALIVHSASGYAVNFTTGNATGTTYTDPRIANVNISSDGVSWTPLGSKTFDDPTNYYTDLSDAFTSSDGTIVADFGKKFDHSPGDFAGLSFSAALALYGGATGAAGGTWIDLGGALSSVQYVEFNVPDLSGNLMYVDSVIAVPEPGALALLSVACVILSRRRALR